MAVNRAESVTYVVLTAVLVFATLGLGIRTLVLHGRDVQRLLPLVVLFVGLTVLGGTAIPYALPAGSVGGAGGEAYNDIIRFEQCPDYYVKSGNDGDKVCENGAVVFDGRPLNQAKLLKLYPAGAGAGAAPQLPDTFGASRGGVLDQFPLYGLHLSMANSADVCNATMGSDPKYAAYGKLPWTHAASRCAHLTAQ